LWLHLDKELGVFVAEQNVFAKLGAKIQKSLPRPLLWLPRTLFCGCHDHFFVVATTTFLWLPRPLFCGCHDHFFVVATTTFWVATEKWFVLPTSINNLPTDKM
jgi:hypothetical protein